MQCQIVLAVFFLTMFKLDWSGFQIYKFSLCKSWKMLHFPFAFFLDDGSALGAGPFHY